MEKNNYEEDFEYFPDKANDKAWDKHVKEWGNSVNYKGEPTAPCSDTRLYKRVKYLYIDGQKIDVSYYVKRSYNK